MPTFIYKARSTNGSSLNGKIEAVSADTAASMLMERGITPIEINEGKNEDDILIVIKDFFIARKKPTAQDLIMFSRQMYTLTKAGVPLTRSLNSLLESTDNKLLEDAIIEIITSLDGGRELSGAMKQHPNVFNQLFISMVEVGENTGDLDHAFLRISTQLMREKHTRDQIKTALRYPTFVILAMVIAITVINIFVIPKFVDIFSRSKVELPIFTVILMTTSNFMINYWYILLGGIATTSYAIRQILKTENGRFAWDKAKLRLPLIGMIIQRATLSRFLSSFSMAMAAGVPLVNALTVVARTEENAYFADRIIKMRNSVERGEPLTRSAINSEIFTPVALQMLSVGEESGNVDGMLLEVSEYYDREVDVKIDALSSAIEPILIVFMGCIVLVLALGVFLPMWDMSKVALGK